MSTRRDDGYALITAVVAMGVLALFSLSMLQSARAALAGAGAAADRARMEAAAEAGLALAVRNLANTASAERWSIDGRARPFRFDGYDLAIRVEDEAGKVPLNQITEEQALTLFEALGLDAETAGRLADTFLDWRDDDDEVRPQGAESLYYEARGIYARNGALRTVDELYELRGFTPALVERLRPAVTIYADNRRGFDDRYAHPLAIAVMTGGGVDSPAAIDRARELAGQRTAIELGARESLAGRALKVRVEVRGPGDARYERAMVIQLTGSKRRPYVVRQYD